MELPEGVWGEHPSITTPEVTMTGSICCGWKMIAGKNYSLAQKISLQWKENFYQSSEFWNEKKNKDWVPYSVHKDCDCAKGWCESKASEPQQYKSLFSQFVRAEIETKRNNANGIVRISKINSALSVFFSNLFLLVFQGLLVPRMHHCCRCQIQLVNWINFLINPCK